MTTTWSSGQLSGKRRASVHDKNINKNKIRQSVRSNCDILAIDGWACLCKWIEYGSDNVECAETDVGGSNWCDWTENEHGCWNTGVYQTLKYEQKATDDEMQPHMNRLTEWPARHRHYCERSGGFDLCRHSIFDVCVMMIGCLILSSSSDIFVGHLFFIHPLDIVHLRNV